MPPKDWSNLFIFFSRIRCVQNQTIVAYIVSSTPFPRNLLVAVRTFIFKIVDFAHFWSILSQSGRKSSLDNIQELLSFLYPKNSISSFSTEKTLYQNVQKWPFSSHSTQFMATEAKIAT